jgi:prevent-host-death family protein
MTQSTWKISEAKARLSELVHACGEEPQVLYNRGKPVAAVIGIQHFESFQQMRAKAEQPSMAALLDELATINTEEGDFGEAPRRVNRPPITLD